MTMEQLRKVHQSKPFRAFALRSSDGREIQVKHPELLAFSENGRAIIVATSDDSHQVIDLRMITSVHMLDGDDSEKP
jgi:hypothetical protein